MSEDKCRKCIHRGNDWQNSDCYRCCFNPYLENNYEVDEDV